MQVATFGSLSVGRDPDVIAIRSATERRRLPPVVVSVAPATWREEGSSSKKAACKHRAARQATALSADLKAAAAFTRAVCDLAALFGLDLRCPPGSGDPLRDEFGSV